MSSRKLKIKSFLKCKNDGILLIRNPENTTTDSGIHIPDTVKRQLEKERVSQELEIFKVMSVDTDNRLGIKSGDKIILSPGSILVPCLHEGVEYVYTTVHSVGGIICLDVQDTLEVYENELFVDKNRVKFKNESGKNDLPN